jgi:hypothetical protein
MGVGLFQNWRRAGRGEHSLPQRFRFERRAESALLQDSRNLRDGVGTSVGTSAIACSNNWCLMFLLT